MVIDDIGNKQLYEFVYDNSWFDLAEGDGKIQRDALVGATGLVTGKTINVNQEGFIKSHLTNHFI